MLRVTLLGNLGADPETRYSAKGTQIVALRVAVNSVRTGPDGERQENTAWFRVRVSGMRTDYVSRFPKGGRVLVIGRLDIGQYQSREGETRTSYDVWADEIQLLGPRQPLNEPEAASEMDGESVPQTVAAAPNGSGRPRAARSGAAVADPPPAAADLEDLPF